LIEISDPVIAARADDGDAREFFCSLIPFASMSHQEFIAGFAPCIRSFASRILCSKKTDFPLIDFTLDQVLAHKAAFGYSMFRASHRILHVHHTKFWLFCDLLASHIQCRSITHPATSKAGARMDIDPLLNVSLEANGIVVFGTAVDEIQFGSSINFHVDISGGDFPQANLRLGAFPCSRRESRFEIPGFLTRSSFCQRSISR
jgi:hypothetical protein